MPQNNRQKGIATVLPAFWSRGVRVVERIESPSPLRTGIGPWLHLVYMVICTYNSLVSHRTAHIQGLMKCLIASFGVYRISNDFGKEAVNKNGSIRLGQEGHG